jgi:hypothetical protein
MGYLAIPAVLYLLVLRPLLGTKRKAVRRG